MDNLAYKLSKRLAKNANSTGRTGNIIAILGIAFAVAVMEITMSVSVGFNNQITEKLLGFVAPVTISSAHYEDENLGLVEMDSLTVDAIRSVCPSAVIKPSLLMQGMIKTDSDFGVIAIKGYDDDYAADFEKANIIEGRWLDADDARGIVVSSTIAKQLDLKVAQKIALCYFVNENIKSRPFDIVGIYDSGFGEYDKTVAYANASTMRQIYHCPENLYSFIELSNIPVDKSEESADKLRSEFIQMAMMQQKPEIAHNVTSVQQQGAVYINWLELLKTNVVVIFILMSLVAACTLISGLFIQILEKINTIGLLRALGTTNKGISNIFVYIALRLVGRGLLLGNIIGLGFILVQHYWRVMSLNPEMYYLNYVPTNIDIPGLLILNLCVVFLSWMVLILPARIATRMSPATTLRFD